MRKEKLTLWKPEEYTYPMAMGFIPNIMTYIHDEDTQIRPVMIVVPGGGYCVVSPTEAEIVALDFYEKGYNAFVLTYTTNLLMQIALGDQPMKDLSRAIRYVRKNADDFHADPDRVVVCGFSAGGHLCGSVCVHYKDVEDRDAEYQAYSNRPDAAILSYPVITTGQYTHQGSIMALLGVRYDLDANGLVCAASEAELAYMSLEKQVTPDTPPCFIWQTAEDEAVPVENSYLFAQACKAQGVPFAHHVFSKGRHGLSLANEVWASGQFGEPYTMEQTMALVNAVRDRQIPLPEETREGILKQFDFSDPNEMFKNMYVNPEVRIWPELAKQWLEKIWHSKDIVTK